MQKNADEPNSPVRQSFGTDYKRAVSLAASTPTAVISLRWDRLRHLKHWIGEWSWFHLLRYVCESRGMLTVDVEQLDCNQLADMIQEDIDKHETHNDKPQTQAAVEETQPQEWPPDELWNFQPGEAAFLRVCFPVSGKLARLLTFLAGSRRGVTLKEMSDEVSPGAQVEDGTVRGYLSDLRKLLRTTFTIAESDDPIPQVDVAPKAAWKLDSEKLSRPAHFQR